MNVSLLVQLALLSINQNLVKLAFKTTVSKIQNVNQVVLMDIIKDNLVANLVWKHVLLVKIVIAAYLAK